MEISASLQTARLYGILDLGYVEEARAVPVAEAMLKGGVQVLQLRAKHFSAEKIAALAARLAPLCRNAGVPFILNDHPSLVSEAGADGVHVGQDDMGVAEARALAGSGAIVGKSTHSLRQALAGQAEGADYLGFGPLFATPTKPDYVPVGLEPIAEVHRSVVLPVFCIGGIKRENLADVLSAGARRVVVVSGILQAENIAGYCQACLEALQAQKG